ncbi:glycosyl transferase family 1 [Mucilaginibacter xinganensis]|uniref:Glycosyl transferase family 1 n=2 Tax=Mucilaginibacter xinganensis TaxID=1234841 RepID=A0A223P3M4_9SPHI|nr:glycosyl transferase family 1 [Mucilaginibacter xinganensis]
MDPVSGGPSQGIRNLNKGMQYMDVVREVVCLDSPDSPYLGKDDFKIHAIGPKKGKWNYSARLIPWLTDNLGRFDVVIVNGLWLYSSYAAWKAIRTIKGRGPGMKVPRMLVMPHGMLDPYFQRAEARKLKAIRNWAYWKLIESKVVNSADGLLFTCETELLLARQTFSSYHPKNEFNVGYGIEAPPLYNQAMSVAFNKLCPELNGEPYMLFLSRIHPKKGVDLLLKAYIDLHKEIKLADGNMPKLVIAGPGMDTRFGKLIQQELVNETGVKGDVFFPGMLTGEAKWGAFYGCDAFVLPSHQENFGIAVAEALACQKTVLITNQVNIWREILNEGAGMVDNDNLSGVQNILKQWVRLTKEEKKQFNNRALIAYQNYFTIDAAAKKMLETFSNSTPLN